MVGFVVVQSLYPFSSSVFFFHLDYLVFSFFGTVYRLVSLLLFYLSWGL